jgi:hypothetical protein
MPRYDNKLRTKDGKLADIWKFLGVHEQTERRAMANGIPYLKAHTDYATPAERAAVMADCGAEGWSKYTEIMDGLLNHIEHKKIFSSPPDPHVDPVKAVGHHHSVNK